MTDSFGIGGVGIALRVFFFWQVRWLLKQIKTTMTTYVTAYTEETARINARIGRIEKLAEEQAHFTRIVESIKDEITAQAKAGTTGGSSGKTFTFA